MTVKHLFLVVKYTEEPATGADIGGGRLVEEALRFIAQPEIWPVFLAHLWSLAPDSIDTINELTPLMYESTAYLFHLGYCEECRARETEPGHDD